MALPQMKTATYLMEVPSTGREIEFRPYTVKEENCRTFSSSLGVFMKPQTIRILTSRLL